MIGAVVGGLFAVLTQTLANRAQRKRDRQTERQALLAILQAIQAEADFHFNFPLPARQICRIHRLPIALKPLQSAGTAQRKLLACIVVLTSVSNSSLCTRHVILSLSGLLSCKHYSEPLFAVESRPK
jgi:hypothetical protein